MALAVNRTERIDQFDFKIEEIMNQRELEICVRKAIDVLHTRDEELFSVEASEWAIAHRLAIYLEQEIPGWNVDCEYNKQGEGGDPKANPITHKTKKNVRPDIILHHRGKPDSEHNLLVIELKKKRENSDLKKARAYTRRPRRNGKRKYKYQFGLALSFFPLEFHWYADGVEITPSVSP
jgi:hypothetical protein